ncbi:MAG: hypothetical protein HC819_16570 [Cyclobacteriaceae bacterium]|nr:hypothetical protein [Cyclobacteriaceae bacterium]
MINFSFVFVLYALFLTPLQERQTASFNKLYPILNEYIKDFPKEFRKIPEERRYRLNEMVYYLEEQEKNRNAWQLMFISSNQSTVGQMAQVWAKIAAYYFGLEKLQTFSGGLQAEPISVNTILALEKAGCIVYKNDLNGLNVYQVKYAYNINPIILYPKKTDHVKNPANDFMAVFVNEHADMNMRNVRGTFNRLLLPYEDLSAYDGSAIDTRQYEESNRKMAVEMFYVFAQLRKRLKNP